MTRLPLLVLLLAPALTAAAARGTYEIDPAHTFPSFEADHMGISVWRGKFNRSRGTMQLDRTAGTGSVDVTVDIGSIDFGLDAMLEPALGPDFFDAASHPTATYRGTLTDFRDGAPTRVDGALTMRGVTRPLDLAVGRFRCIPHPMHGRELCGADAVATFDRGEFGLTAGRDHGFDMEVTLRIQFEAVQAE